MFEGNIADAKTLEMLLDRLEIPVGGRKPDQKVEVRKIEELQKKHARVRRLDILKHSGGTLEVVRDEEKMTRALYLCGDCVLKSEQTLDATQL